MDNNSCYYTNATCPIGSAIDTGMGADVVYRAMEEPDVRPVVSKTFQSEQYRYVGVVFPDGTAELTKATHIKTEHYQLQPVTQRQGNVVLKVVGPPVPYDSSSNGSAVTQQSWDFTDRLLHWLGVTDYGSRREYQGKTYHHTSNGHVYLVHFPRITHVLVETYAINDITDGYEILQALPQEKIEFGNCDPTEMIGLMCLREHYIAWHQEQMTWHGQLVESQQPQTKMIRDRLCLSFPWLKRTIEQCYAVQQHNNGNVTPTTIKHAETPPVFSHQPYQ